VKEFRKRGEIALSRDVVSVAAMAGGVIALIACAGAAGPALMGLARDAALAGDGRGTAGLASSAIKCFTVIAVPVMVSAAVAALVAITVQLGFPPAFKKIGFDFSKLSPFTNVGQVFSLKTMARRSGAAVAKLVVVGAVVAVALHNDVLANMVEAGGISAAAWSVVSRVLWLVLGALVLVAAGDYFLARRGLATRMKMTADEVKREHRENEGDPIVRGRRRQRMRELAKRRIAVTVATADVVIVNPTHYAVALRYDDSSDRAPIVVAKGIDELAEKIREVARQHHVPVVSRPPLARALHKHVKENQPIPSNLFRAVAEVLAYVYKLRAQRGGS
jgi:flagellar biosynthesis protein FlhB